jgi:hypothetical protein
MKDGIKEIQMEKEEERMSGTMPEVYRYLLVSGWSSTKGIFRDGQSHRNNISSRF